MVYQSLIRRFHAIQQLSDLKRIVKIQSFIRYYNAYRKAIFYWVQRNRAATSLQKSIRRYEQQPFPTCGSIHSCAWSHLLHRSRQHNQPIHSPAQAQALCHPKIFENPL